ncbi:MAG TPA: Asp-tRNA(Asn)/Glu-tRNA(Gln) amidotransferase subunit GatC [Gemmatimonadaceae bacterium]|nr:Asp-tRNA(Asn)/Glu-tRNA(Gln) amidotransferase subunit GatC [Gemmatimonadaceae bacterium]
MAVTHDDVRHVAELARLAVEPDRLDHLVAELNSILSHMDVLSQVDTKEVEKTIGAPMVSTPLRSDASGPLPMLTPKEDFAPDMRDRLFVVPRLASHDEGADRAP